MKRSEKRKQMIEIFAPYISGSLIRELIDKCLDIDNPSKKQIEDIKDTMKKWYGFDLTDDQVIEYLRYRQDCNSIENLGFDTVEREDFGYYLAEKITGLNWPMNGDDDKIKEDFFKSLAENAPKFGYKWQE